jgi:hypothetical protein
MLLLSGQSLDFLALGLHTFIQSIDFLALRFNLGILFLRLLFESVIKINTFCFHASKCTREFSYF